MKKSHTLISRRIPWQLLLTILFALTFTTNVLAAPADSSGEMDTTVATVANDATILASSQSTYNLTVSTVGSGIVTQEPDQTTYLAGTFVNLTATAAEGFVFSGWSGACFGTGVCTVTMDGDTVVTANFDLIAGPDNDAPSFSSTPVLTATIGDSYTYFITANDPDAGDILAFSALAIPSWLTLGATGDGTAILIGTPEWSHLGAHIMRLQVQDSAGAFATQEFVVIVNAPEPAATGSIQGMVVDAEGNGIGGAIVTSDSGNGEVASTSANNQITNSNGSYRFEAVPPGDYTITIRLNDQSPDTLIAVTVLPGELAEIPAVTLQASLLTLHLPLLSK